MLNPVSVECPLGFFKNITLPQTSFGSGYNRFSLPMHLERKPIITAPKRSLEQGNVFTPVCQSFCSQWPRKRTVRILLECILVLKVFAKNCMKMKEIGPCPLDPPMWGRVCNCNCLFHLSRRMVGVQRKII